MCNMPLNQDWGQLTSIPQLELELQTTELKLELEF